MRATSPDSLVSSLTDLIAICSRAAAIGFESALAGAVLRPPAGLVKRDSEDPTTATSGRSSSDAVVAALTEGLKQWGLSPKQIAGLRQRLEGAAALTPKAKSLIEAALVPSSNDAEPEPGADDELDLDELVGDLEKRLTGISADLSAVTALWDQMDEGPRAALLDQLRYYAELHAFYAGDRGSPAGDARANKSHTARAKR